MAKEDTRPTELLEDLWGEPRMEARIEKFLEQAREDTYIGILCGEGCQSDTFYVRIVGREGRVSCTQCGDVTVTLHLETATTPAGPGASEVQG